MSPIFYLLTVSILVFSISAVKSQHNGFLTQPLNHKLTHLRVFWHDILTGRNPTSVMVIKPPANSNRGFGFTNMIDNPLTLEPNLGSKEIGRAKGLYALASQEDLGLLMVMNFVFTHGKYNGSTITILGHNAVFNPTREMSIVGGTGVFRFATGYVELRTQYFSSSTGDATVEYNLHILHY